MTHKEAIKNLTELQLRLINDNSEEAIEYNKKIYDTLAYFITQAIPLSVIEKIHTEVGNLEWYGDDAFWDGVNAVTSIIDKVIKEAQKDA